MVNFKIFITNKLVLKVRGNNKTVIINSNRTKSLKIILKYKHKNPLSTCLKD